MSPRPSEFPGLDATLRQHSEDLRALKRGPGRLILVGNYPSDAGTVPESPPFQNGWANVGGGFAPLGFYIDKWRRVFMQGAAEGGAMGTVITQLPAEYRPPASERFICPGETTFAVIQIDPNGDVTQVA